MPLYLKEALRDKLLARFDNEDYDSAIMTLLKSLAHARGQEELAKSVDIVELKVEHRRTEGISRIDEDYWLRRYYSVQPGAELIPFQGRERTINELEHKIKNWNPSCKQVYLVTGLAGSGKTWFCYELLSRLRTTFDILKVETSEFHFESIHPLGDKSFRPHLFILDDNWISIGEKRTTRLVAKDLVMILASQLENDGRPASGPLILSIKWDTWETEISNELDKSKLDRVVDTTKLSPLGSFDAKKLITSFVKSMPGLKVSDNLATQIIEKTCGLPLLLKLFFDSTISPK
jgi:hypothetical protein